jgi:hypothetical protein
LAVSKWLSSSRPICQSTGVFRAHGKNLFDSALANQEMLAVLATTTDSRRREKSKGISSIFE